MAKTAVQPTEISSQDKIARLLGLLAIKGMEQKPDQIALLLSAGFQPTEVAAMVGVTQNYIDVLSYRERKKKNRRRLRKSKR